MLLILPQFEFTLDISEKCEGVTARSQSCDQVLRQSISVPFNHGEIQLHGAQDLPYNISFIPVRSRYFMIDHFWQI